LDEKTYFDKITTSVSGWWGKPKGGQNAGREKIISCTFDTYEIENELRRCIIVVYLSGFQIWDITDLNHVFEVYSVRGYDSISMVKMLPTPAGVEDKDCPFYNARPAVLVVQNRKTDTTACNLTFISFIKKLDNVKPIHLKQEVLDVQCNPHAICLKCKRVIHLLNPITLSIINVGTKNSIRCYPDGPVGLSSRWLAYATLDTADEMLDQPISTIDVAKDVGFKVASTIVNTYSLALSTYRGSEDTPATPQSQKEKEKLLNEAAGTIAIYDIVEEKFIYKIKAHKEAISNLTFDPSGSLLSTASITGNSLNIIRFNSKIHWDNGQKRIFITGNHLYTLYRGHTNAVITNVEFSSDSKWVAVQTSKGTTHLFALNPEGGEVNTRTHPPLAEKTNEDFHKSYYKEKKPETYILYALDRLYQSDGILEGIFQCSFVPGISRKLLLSTPGGTLTQNQLQPVRSMDAENNAILTLNVSPEQEWDINRKLNTLEVKGDFTSIAKLTNQIESDKSQTDYNRNQWASFGETRTFDTKRMEMKKLMITQRNLFHFQTYEEQHGVDMAESVLGIPKEKARYQQPSASIGSPNKNPSSGKSKNQKNVNSLIHEALNTKLDKKNSNESSSESSSNYQVSPIRDYSPSPINPIEKQDNSFLERREQLPNEIKQPKRPVPGYNFNEPIRSPFGGREHKMEPSEDSEDDLVFEPTTATEQNFYQNNHLDDDDEEPFA